MSIKKKQYIIKQINFKNIKGSKEKLFIDKDDFNEFSISENFLIEKLYQIINMEYVEPLFLDGRYINSNITEEIFILKATNISERNIRQYNRYKRIMQEGCYIGGVKYVRCEKSSNMTRTQKTLFVRESLKNELVEHISLGKTPEITYISKYISAKGLMLSSIYNMPYMPNICVIPDFERIISGEYDLSFMVEDKNDLGFAKINIKEYEKRIGENFVPEINAFDGMGLMSYSFAEKVNEFLGENTNAIIGRLPYIKGCFIKFDIKNYIKNELKTDKIMDIFNVEHNVENIDVLITESCFKAKLDVRIEEGQEIKHWLFKDMAEYYSLLRKYGYRSFGIANYAKGFEKMKRYNPTTYQLLSTLDLSKSNIFQLAKEQLEVTKNVLFKADTAKVKQFLQMIDGFEEAEEDKIMSDYIKEAIEINERMIFDRHIQIWIYQQVKRYMEGMLLGRILIPATIMYATGDIIGLCEWAAYRDPKKVKGFLEKNEFYCAGENKEKILIRYPLTHWSEIRIAQFIHRNNKYLKHLDNIIQCNSYDLTMMRMNLDYDGDFVTCIDADMPIEIKENEIIKGLGLKEVTKTLKDAIIKDNVIFNVDDKALSTAKKLNNENIIEFELKNINNLTGKVTNINTTILDMASQTGNLKGRDLEISICKYLQGEIIDSVKKGTTVKIPEALKEIAKYKPYYFKHLYGGDDKNYRFASSQLSKFVRIIEGKIKKYFPRGMENQIGIEADKTYLDVAELHNLLIDKSKYDDFSYIEIMNRIIPVFNSFSSKKGEIDNKRRAINPFDNSDEAKQMRKQIQEKYCELYAATKQSCYEICDNESVLASICVKIAYIYSKNSNMNEVNRTKTYLFPWITAPKGLLENLKSNTDDEFSTVVKKINFSKINKLRLLPEQIAIDKNNVWQMEGKYYTSFLRPKTIKAGRISPAIKSDAIIEKKKINNYVCRLSYLGERTGQETKAVIDGQIVKLGFKDDKYLSLYKDEEFVGSIAKESYEDIACGILLKDYVGDTFKAKIEKVNNKSLSIKLNQVI